jgi:hypothetical protein
VLAASLPAAAVALVGQPEAAQQPAGVGPPAGAVGDPLGGQAGGERRLPPGIAQVLEQDLKRQRRDALASARRVRLGRQPLGGPLPAPAAPLGASGGDQAQLDHPLLGVPLSEGSGRPRRPHSP